MTHENGALDVERLHTFRIPETRDRYDRRDTILYALAVGAGLGRPDETALVYERGLVALPTMALVLGTPGFWLMAPQAGLDWPRILHGEQSFRLHRPLEPEGDAKGHTEIVALGDKGPGRAAFMRCRRELTDGATGALLASLEELWVLRGAGGFGGEDLPPSPPLPPVPERSPDAALDLPTTVSQAMLYRLTGDRNPLHVDPEIARDAGFDRPILHGLATMGVIGRALIHLACADDARRLAAMRTRFTAPVYPGDSLRTELWEEDGTLRYRTTAIERDVIAADGIAERFSPLTLPEEG